MTLIRCGGLCCVRLVSNYLNDIPCKNYNYVFAFVKVIPKILLVPFFSGHGVYTCLNTVALFFHFSWFQNAYYRLTCCYNVISRIF